MSEPVLKAVAKTIIRRPPAEVYAAFVEGAQMSRFWFTRRDARLEEGKPCTWYLGAGEDAYEFDVSVIKLSPPQRIVIDWGDETGLARVTWTIEETAEGDSVLTIEESGYAGTPEENLARALDSTGGFNQVIIACKAMLEYDADLNVVADHAK